MATLSRWAVFVRVLLLTLLTGGGASRVVAADQIEMDMWAAAKSQNTAAGYYRYLALYPSGDYVEQAISALLDLKVVRQAPPTRQVPKAPAAPKTPKPPKVTPPPAPPVDVYR